MLNVDAFSIATLFYTRLRRVTGRVIDVVYFLENKNYALHVLQLAEKAGDQELDHLIKQLKGLFDFKAIQANIQHIEEPLEVVEPTDDDVFRSQVHHHYIGALR